MCTNARPTSLHDKQLGCYGLTTGTHKEQICGGKTMQGGHATIQMAQIQTANCRSALLHEPKHNVGNALFNETGLLQSSPPQSHRRRTVPARLIEQPILNVTIIALAQQAGKALGAFPPRAWSISYSLIHTKPVHGVREIHLLHAHTAKQEAKMTTVARIVAFTVPKPSEHAPPTAKPCDSGQCSDWNVPKSQEYGFSTAEPCDSRHFSDTTVPKPRNMLRPTAKPWDSCHFSSTNLPKPKENTHSKIDCQKSGSGRENRNVENLVKDSNFLSSSTFNVAIFRSGSAFLAI